MVKCEICNRRDAKYVCKECGRRVCELCFDPYTWTCIECLDRLKHRIKTPIYTPTQISTSMFNSIVKFTTLGFIIIFIGMILIMLGAITGGVQVSGGIIIVPFIPLPLIIGYGPEALTSTLMLIIIGIIALIVLFTIIWYASRKMNV
mgnify:CR=1 FL=1